MLLIGSCVGLSDVGPACLLLAIVLVLLEAAVLAVPIDAAVAADEVGVAKLARGITYRRLIRVFVQYLHLSPDLHLPFAK